MSRDFKIALSVIGSIMVFLAIFVVIVATHR